MNVSIEKNAGSVVSSGRRRSIDEVNRQAISAAPPAKESASVRPSVSLHTGGLSAAEAKLSAERWGANVITRKKRKSFLSRFVSNFSDPIIRILLGALVVNVLFMMGDINWFETGGIAAAILIATLVSTISEHTGGIAFEKLLESGSGGSYTVMRDGSRCSVPAEEICVGDEVYLSPGDFIPADGVIVSGEVRLDQSSLTGESKEIVRSARKAGSVIIMPPEAEFTPQNGKVLLRGAAVCSGECAMIVCRVGDGTMYGKAAAELQEEDTPSPLKERLSRLAKTISIFGYIGAFLIALAFLAHSFLAGSGMDKAIILSRLTDARYVASELISAVTLAVSVIVVAVPEGLPMMITVVLSSNMKRMMKAGVLVRRMVGIETAGGMNILFTDKTGTVTTGKLRAAGAYFDGVEIRSSEEFRQYGAVSEAYSLAHIACTRSSAGNATDKALAAFSAPLRIDLTPVGRVPFDSSRKYAAASYLRAGRAYTVLRGAPEYILSVCTKYMTRDGGTAYMSGIRREEYLRKCREWASRSCRVIACAYTSGDVTASLDSHLAGEFTLICLACIKDELRPDAAQSVKTVREAGVQVVMITGDNPDTAAAIAAEAGILTDGLSLGGEKLRYMSDDEVKKLLPRLQVVSRALPSDKSRLVRLARECEMIVGMTGDGINDAPALRSADVGFAMGSGTDVAKSAGDIIITDDKFSSIGRAILYGRTVFENIRKFIIFQLTMNLCAMGVSLLGPFFGIESPVTVIQMLWVNIIMDTLGGLAFAGEPALKEYMKRPPAPRGEAILTGGMLGRIAFTGLYTLALSMWFLVSGFTRERYLGGGETYFLTVFFALFIFCGVLNCFNARCNRLNILAHLGGNKAFIAIILIVGVCQTAIIYFGGTVFRTTPLEWHHLGEAMLMASTVIPADMIRKAIFRKRK